MSVAWLNTTLNGTQPSSCQHSTAENIGITFAYCLLMVVSLAGNTFIRLIVYKTESMRKLINFFIVNMAMSDLLCVIFVFPRFLSSLYIDYWLLRGPLGQALCKLLLLFQDISICVTGKCGSDSSGSIWSCGISPPFPTHQFKAVPVLHSRHLDRRNGSYLSISLRLQTCSIYRKVCV